MMRMRSPIRRFPQTTSTARWASALCAALFVSTFLAAAEPWNTRALRPGELFPQPPQRRLDEIDGVPERPTPCPVCGFTVNVPDADLLMRRRPGGIQAVWRMQAESRDADLCPYPDRRHLAYQADIAICPSCGYAARSGSFASHIPPETADWVRATLQPNIRRTERDILGKRGEDMTDAAISEFFNRQSEIPDTIRTEHARVTAEALRASRLDRAELTWLAAWAARRETVGPPRGDLLAKRWAALRSAMDRARRQRADLANDADVLHYLLGKNSSGKDRLAYGDRLAARLMRTAADIRLGLYPDAERELGKMYLEARERFLKPDQDPLWAYTAHQASRDFRVAELDAMRAETERELETRIDLLHVELDHLRRAAELVREAMLAGELDGKRAEALFHAYLVGEFLRRNDNCPLAAEWFKNLLPLTPEGSPLREAAEIQLQRTREQAGDRVNLLSALGQDGELFEKLREICKPVDPTNVDATGSARTRENKEPSPDELRIEP